MTGRCTWAMCLRMAGVGDGARFSSPARLDLTAAAAWSVLQCQLLVTIGITARIKPRWATVRRESEAKVKVSREFMLFQAFFDWDPKQHTQSTETRFGYKDSRSSRVELEQVGLSTDHGQSGRRGKESVVRKSMNTMHDAARVDATRKWECFMDKSIWYPHVWGYWGYHIGDFYLVFDVKNCENYEFLSVPRRKSSEKNMSEGYNVPRVLRFFSSIIGAGFMPQLLPDPIPPSPPSAAISDWLINHGGNK
ncbi:hypothetical protein B0H11DRAFT_1902363 [Mycena galericulata]|nr:hypothetical protein B0H11DRAFT_1902363 [Mycena galericulata]